MKYLFAVIFTVLTIWFLFSWGEVAHNQIHKDYEYSDINLFVMLIGEEAQQC